MNIELTDWQSALIGIGAFIVTCLIFDAIIAKRRK